MNTIRAIHAFGGNIAIIGGILIVDVETVANTAVHKSDSVHLLHNMGFRKEFRELFSFFSNRPKRYISG